jgi:hypothetical protein
MSKRDVAELRKRIETERSRLDDHLTALEGELLSGAPLLVAGLVTAAAVFLRVKRARKKPRSVTITWRLK